MTRRGGVVIAAVAAAGVIGLATVRSLRPARPNVVLITADTLRADRLGAYGATPSQTPTIDRLAREGLLFENAACPMPQTRPSHFSIMTSRYPRDHGVLNNVTPLPDQAVTLPELFREAGYRTGGFVAVQFLDRASGAAQGFETFEAPQATKPWTADEVVSRTLSWLRRADDRPFFLWVHVFDPHMPYEPPPEHRPSGPLAAELPEVSWPVLERLAQGSTGGGLSRDVLDRALGLYAGEVAFTDQSLGTLLEHLDASGIRGRTAVLFTADHGECFENGIFFEHSDCLYDGAVRVPLILRHPGVIAPGVRNLRQVENLDIAPTLLRLAGLAVPAVFKGRSLLEENATASPAFLQRPLYQPQAAQNRPRRNEVIRAVAGERVRAIQPEVDLLGLRTPEWKYIRAGRDEELYDLRVDRGETRNVAAASGAVLAELRGRLQRWVIAHPLRPADPGLINEELRENLRSLGYVF